MAEEKTLPKNKSPARQMLEGLLFAAIMCVAAMIFLLVIT